MKSLLLSIISRTYGTKEKWLCLEETTGKILATILR